MEKKGSLIITGTGLRLSQISLEAEAHIKHADKVFYAVSDAVTVSYLSELNAGAENLAHFYQVGKPRKSTYHDMVNAILAPVRAGLKVCAVFYGHPGVFVYPSHEAVRQARAEGYEAAMLPGISAEDCLFADLGVDPAHHGCASFEATDFLVYERIFDPHSALVLWQVGVIGDLTFQQQYNNIGAGIRLLTQKLLASYPDSHELIIYEFPQLLFEKARMEKIALRDLPGAALTRISTMYVPPVAKKAMNQAIAAELGLTEMLRMYEDIKQ